MPENEPTIEIPVMLLRNLINCLEAQKTLSENKLDNMSIIQIQKLIDTTKEWAKQLLQKSGTTGQRETNIEETLSFVQSNTRIKTPTGPCDEDESFDSCSVSIIEPDNSQGGFL
mgnify:CR=1 FL=1